MGGVTFRDEVTIVRVLDDGAARFDMAAFKRSIEAALKQEKVLIICPQGDGRLILGGLQLPTERLQRGSHQNDVAP